MPTRESKQIVWVVNLENIFEMMQIKRTERAILTTRHGVGKTITAGKISTNKNLIALNERKFDTARWW